jgi:hypothetical protein
MSDTLDDDGFDNALVGAAFAIAGRSGWGHVTVAEAAVAAGLPLARARARFPSRFSVLLRFGVMVDQAALTGAGATGPVRDRLFDMLMRRIDALQAHREGVLAALRYLPTDPPLALLMSRATLRSMRWMLETAGEETHGLRGQLAVKGLSVVWLWTVRAWRTDDSADLTATMAALDKALSRAERAADWFEARKSRPAPAVAEAAEADMSAPDVDPPPDMPPSAPDIPPSAPDIPPSAPDMPPSAPGAV